MAKPGLQTKLKTQVVREDNILLREARKSDLPQMRRLLTELVNALDDAEGIDIRSVFTTC